jgi:hypothetical protein
VFPPSKEAQLVQNRLIDELGLERIKDEKQLRELVKDGRLVSLNFSAAIDPKLPRERRFTRPWVIPFVEEINATYYAQFGQALIVTSAIRTVKVQRRLLWHNRNAASVHGETASSHLSGSTIDLARKHMTVEQNRFMEALLMTYAVRNRAIIEEEAGQQWCWHIMVLPGGYDETIRMVGRIQ